MSAYTPEELSRLAEEKGRQLAEERAEQSAADSRAWAIEEQKRLALQLAAPALLAACEAAAAWLHDPNDAAGQFERLADEFHRETGFTRPGKDAAAAAHQDRTECDIAWNEWRVARGAKVLADLRAAIAKARGGK